jgi:hypothetical protein
MLIISTPGIGLRVSFEPVGTSELVMTVAVPGSESFYERTVGTRLTYNEVETLRDQLSKWLAKSSRVEPRINYINGTL